jgi:DegV family protein with EDD domain
VIALVTDSNALVPEDLRRRFDVQVVPLTVVVDGHAYAEGVDLTTRDFYTRLAAGAVVATAAPPPGAFIDVYERAAAQGAAEVLSVHIGSNTSATLESATVAARAVDVPVELVDTGTASFPVGCCVWAAGLALERGAELAEAAAVARAVAGQVGNVFVAGAIDLARRGGRLQADANVGEDLPVLALQDGRMRVVGHAREPEDAVDAMVTAFDQAARGRPSRVGVGDAAADELATALIQHLQSLPEVVDLVRYEVGPSVAAHTGLGTAGLVHFPAEFTAAGS